MKRLILAAAAVLSMSACTKGDLIVSNQEAVAAVRLLGVKDVVLERPQFNCDAYGDQPRVSPTPGASYLQNGYFFRGMQNGKPVKGAVCVGYGRTPRVQVNGIQ
ncbi:hypothetical protein HOU00_gp332 [Caulobacter phage CcrPW]|uniref:Lipoprotein n=1 Tax=Caulobacter phage CcrPW TaxID=2283271 RepID=A0A385EAH0_9CAUD|nr:hypothetical protein HOU00_gp332 [Caulobacter phage CcrPW]AXQ68793.1 hypothetical protein CcrPW_gp254 [Caulobacter phage CcrPW]